MSQFGMQLPGGRAKRAASLDVYTAMAFVAVLFLGVACAMMWLAGAKVGVDGNPLQIQESGKVVLKKPA